MPVMTRSQHHAMQALNPQAGFNQQANTSASTSGSAPNAPVTSVIEAPASLPASSPAFSPSLSPESEPEPEPEPPALLPHEHLRLYIQSAEIPQVVLYSNHPTIYRGMGCITPPDRFLLSIEPDSRFRLREIWVSKPTKMADRVTALIREHIPQQPIPDADSRGVDIRTANFSLPAEGFLTFIEPSPPVNNAFGLAKCVMQVLETAERVVNLVWPEESKGLRFTFPTDCSSVPEADAPICVPLFYQKVREQDLVSVMEPKVKMVVIVLAPWAIATKDILEMLTTGKFPTPSIKPDETWPTFSRAHKVWAQIYECCASQNCPFFILTTQDQWLFGSFHTAYGWSRVVITTIMAHTDVNPSILEWVVFWCASTIKIPGGWSPNGFTHPRVNPEIADPNNIQIASSEFDDSMTTQDWLDNYYSHLSNERPVTMGVVGYHNTYITSFQGN